jgi:hypothetical protein
MLRRTLVFMLVMTVLAALVPEAGPGLLLAQDKAKPAKAPKASAKTASATTKPATPGKTIVPAAEPAKPVELSTEAPLDMIKGDVNFTIKVVLPPGEKMGRDVYFRVAGYTVLNSRPKLYEWSQFGKEEASGKIERASVLVFTAGRDAKTEGKGQRTALQAKPFIWRAKLTDAKPGQTDLPEPTSLQVTLELKAPEPIAEEGLKGTDVSWDLKLDGTQFTVGAIWFDKAGKPQTETFANLKELQAGLSTRGVASAMIIRGNETDNDTDPVSSIKVYSVGVRRSKGLAYLAFWMTDPKDGLLLIKRISSPTEDFPRMTQAPQDIGLLRKHVVFRQNDLGDFSSANKANAKGPIFYGKLADKFFKFQIDELIVNPDPTQEPFKLTGRVVVQPDGSANLVGQ